MSSHNRSAVIVSSLFLSIAISLAGFFISRTLYNAKIALNTADVKGLAEKRVIADKAFWTIQYTVSGHDKANMAKLYQQSELDQMKIIALLTDNGFTKDEIVPGVIHHIKREFRDDHQKLVDEKHSLIGEIEVQTSKVKLVARVRSKLNTLVAQGLEIDNNDPAYYFTQLNKIKPAMLKEATRNARLAANEFAKNAGVKVGGIRNARQGGFIIRDVGQSYGDTKKIEKNVRVVTNVTFFLTE